MRHSINRDGIKDLENKLRETLYGGGMLPLNRTPSSMARRKLETDARERNRFESMSPVNRSSSPLNELTGKELSTHWSQQINERASTRECTNSGITPKKSHRPLGVLSAPLVAASPNTLPSSPTSIFRTPTITFAHIDGRPSPPRRSPRKEKTAISLAQFLKVKGLFDDIDIERKGRITLKELLSYASRHPIPFRILKRTTFDAEGKVTLAELIRCHYPKIHIKDIRHAIEVFTPQLNDDWRERLNSESTKEIAEIFNQLDTNSKGYLTFNELSSLLIHRHQLNTDELLEMIQNIGYDPTHITIQCFETLMKDYYMSAQQSTDRHPTFDFLVPERRVYSLWQDLFPYSKDPSQMLL